MSGRIAEPAPPDERARRSVASDVVTGFGRPGNGWGEIGRVTAVDRGGQTGDAGNAIGRCRSPVWVPVDPNEVAGEQKRERQEDAGHT